MTTRTRAERFPLGARVSLHDLDHNPYPVLRQLQESEPVSWVGDVGMWFVTRRADVIAVLKDPETFTTDSPASPIRAIFGAQMLSTDGPVRHRYKSHCVPAFTAKAVRETLAAEIEHCARELVQAFGSHGATDLRRSFASILPVRTITAVLGLPGEDEPRVRAWYDDFAPALANFVGDPKVRGRGLAAAESFRAHVRSHLRSLSREPNRSLLAVLATETRDPLSEDEILANALIILFGGIETTESQILNAVWALLQHEDQLREVRSDPQLAAAALEESLRWEPAVQSCTRYVRHATAIHGVELAEGEIVQCMLGAANRDPAWIPDPDRFSIHRPQAAEHLSFGIGQHFCLGAPLARLEARIACEQLLTRLGDIELAVPAGELTFVGHGVVRRVERLPLRFTPPGAT